MNLKHVLCNFECKLSSTTCNSNQNCNNETCQCACKNYRTCKKDYIWNPSTCICEDGKYLKSIVDDSIVCDEVINATDIVSTNMKNTISTNATSTVSINRHNEKVRYEMDYILLSLSLVIIILFMVTFICQY